MINKTLHIKMSETQLKHIQGGRYTFERSYEREGRLRINELRFQPNTLETGKKNTLKECRMQEINIRNINKVDDIYEIDMNSKAKSWFFEKNNPIDQILMEKNNGIRRKEQNQEALKIEMLLGRYMALS